LSAKPPTALNCFVLGFLPEALVTRKHGINRGDERGFHLLGQRQLVPDPMLQLVPRLRLRSGGRQFVGAHHRDSCQRLNTFIGHHYNSNGVPQPEVEETGISACFKPSAADGSTYAV
jgi:hypothetical protein